MKLKDSGKAEVALYACFALYLVNIYLARTVYVIDFPGLSVAGLEVSSGLMRTLVGMAVAVAALCAYKPLDAFIRTRGAVIVAAVANLVGTLLVLLSSYAFSVSPAAPAISVAGYALTSAASTLLALVVVQLFVAHRSKVKLVVYAFLAAMLLNAFVAFVGPFGHALLQVALPFAVCWLWGIASSEGDVPSDDEAEISSKDVDFLPLAASYFLFVFSFSLATSFSRWQYLSAGASDSLLRCAVVLVFTVLAGIAIYMSKRSYLQFNTIALYRATLLFFVASLCIMLIARNAAEVAHSAQFVSDLLLRTLIFVTAYRICQRYRLSTTLVLCGGALARYCASALFNVAEMTAPAIDAVALNGAIILLLMVVYTVVFTERNLENLTERRKPREREATAESRVEALREKYGLTKRETEVARLMGQGRTVAFIADELFVSPRTVSTHVTNIYGKMGVHSRQDFLSIFQEAHGDLPGDRQSKE